MTGPTRLHAQRIQMLDSGDLVARCAIVLGDLRLDDCLRSELSRDDEIRRLIKAFHTACPLSFAVADAGSRHSVLYRCLKHVADQLAHGVAMAGEWSPEESLIKQHCIWHAEVRKWLKTGQTPFRIRLVETVENALCGFGRALIKKLTGSDNKRADAIADGAVVCSERRQDRKSV